MNSYAYHPLPDYEDAIRLLLLLPSTDDDGKLSCQLIDTRLSNPDVPGYTAVSHTLGVDQPKHSLKVDGHKIRIGSNLKAALRHLRRKDQIVHFWVDELCINQDDIAERNRLVRSRRTIYSTAKETVIYLGGDDQSNTTRSAWNFLERNSSWAMNSDGEVDFELPGVREDEIAFRGDLGDVEIDVLYRPWFRRCWGFQEAVVPKNLSVQCGRRKISWDDFAKTILKTPRLRSQYRYRSLHWTKKIESIQRIQHARSIYRTSQDALQQPQGNGLDILDLLARSENLEAFDPRDKIFAFLGIASHDGVEGDEFIVDYSKPCREVYTDFAKWHIQSTGSYDILSYLDGELSKHDIKLPEKNESVYQRVSSRVKRSTTQLPSWTPNWKAFDFNRISEIPFDPRMKGQGTSAGRSQIPSTTGSQGQALRGEIPSSHYKPRRLTILEPSNEDEVLKSTRKRVVRQNHSFSNDFTQSLACNGTILGTIDLLGPRIFLSNKNESKFQSLRYDQQHSSSSEKDLYNVIMQEWQTILSNQDNYDFDANPLSRYLRFENIAKFSATFESLRQVDLPTRNSVEYYLFERARESGEGSCLDGKDNATIRDRESIVDGRRLGVYVKPSLATQSESEELEPEKDNDTLERALVLLPKGAQPGDFIAHFKGARVAFVVRELEDPSDISAPEMFERFKMNVDEETEVVCCQIVGECLVDGLPGLDLEKGDDGLLDESWEIVERPSSSPKCIFVIS